jgi:hypothetical protein
MTHGVHCLKHALRGKDSPGELTANIIGEWNKIYR